LVSKNFQNEDNEGNAKEIDEKLNVRLTGQKDIGVFIKKFDEKYSQYARKRLNT